MADGKTAIQGRFVGFRLWIEGIEVDVVEGQVAAGLNAPATANITIPYNDYIHKFEPRTLVHLFFMDSKWEVGAEAQKGGSTQMPPRLIHYNKQGFKDAQTADAEKARSVAAKMVDKNDPLNWKLMFVGEILGYKYQKVGALRQVVLMCQDMTSYLQQAKLHWGRQNTSLSSYKQAIFAGATQLYRGKARVDSANDLVKLLSVRASTHPQVPGLLGGLIATLESVTGVFTPDSVKKFRGISDFMSQAELRLKLTHMIGASEQDDTTATFITSRSFRRYLRKLTKQMKGTASYYDMMNVVLQKCYQVWNSTTAPPYIDSGTIKVEWLKKISGFNYKNDPNVNPFFKDVDATYEKIATEITKGKRRRAQKVATSANTTDATMAVALTDDFIRCENVGGTVKVASSGHKGVQKFTSGKLGKTSTHGDQDAISKAGSDIYQAALAETGQDGSTNIVDNAKIKAARKVNTAYQRVAQVKKLIDGLEDQKSGDFSEHTEATYYEIKENLEIARNLMAKAAGIRTQRKEAYVKVNPRLHCLLFHPDIFMCPPPKCNVLFPDQIQSISFSRGWMSEVSRVWMHGRTESGRARKDCYFSPNTSILSSSDKLSETAIKKGHTFLMRHERFTGINSLIVGLGDNDIFKKIHVKGLAKHKKDVRKKAKDAKESLDTQSFEDEISMFTGPAQHSPQVHLQRAANYMFWVNRYNSRVIGIHARFSPQLVAGMPCLVLDPMRGSKSRFIQDKTTELFKKDSTERHVVVGMPTSAGEEIKTRKPRGTHFVGTIASIQHTFSADDGANTLIQLIKCREHNEASDIFKDDDNDGKFDSKRVKKKYWSRKVKIDGEHHSLNGLSANGEFQTGTTAQGNKEEDYAAIMGSQYKRGVKYTMRSKKNPGSKKPIPSNLMYEDDGYGNFSSPASREEGRVGIEVEVYRHGSSSDDKDVNFTFEAMATPPWFSDIYHAGNIGAQYYQPMIGCLSCVDGAPIELKAGDEWEEGLPITEVAESSDGDTIENTFDTIKLPISTTDGKETREVLIPKALMDPTATTAAAADVLAELWLGLKEVGANTNLFIDAYNDRAYATIVDILGNVNADITLKVQDMNSQDVSLGDVPVEGFHTWAVGKLSNFETGDESALAFEAIHEALPKSNPRSKTRKIDPSVDTRAEKYAPVESYVREMTLHYTAKKAGIG